MRTGARWGVSLAVGGLVAATSLLAGRLVTAPAAVAEPPPAPVASSAGPSVVASPQPSVSPSPLKARRPASRPASPSGRPKPAFPQIRIAATAPGNRLFGVEATDCPTCASGSRVMYVGQGHGITVHVHDVPVAGRRSLTIYYESVDTRPLQIVVADSPVVTLTLPGGSSWITPAQAKIGIDLPAGDSDIKLFHPDKPAPDLDQIVIR